MAEYIEREAAIQAIAKLYRKPIDIYTTDITDELMKVPAADVRPAARGKWEVEDFHTVCCSKCRFSLDIMEVSAYVLNAMNFCPNCGADMREDN